MDVSWSGFVNARDLGGIAIGRSGLTMPSAFVRSENPGKLTVEGWRELYDYGVRTIVSLETGGLSAADHAQANLRFTVPAELDDVRVARATIEDASDDVFMNTWASTGLWGTPLYYRDALRRWPHLYAGVLDSLAGAEGPMLFHCARGHDRTGLVALLLLANAGVEAHEIAADYLLSCENLERVRPGSRSELFDLMADAGTTVEESIHDTVTHLNDDFWSSGTVSASVRGRLREKLTARQ